MHRCFIEVRRVDDFVRVRKICFFRRLGESEYSVHRKKNANPQGVDVGNVLIP